MIVPRINLETIARQIGVSKMSVSRALNGQKGISETLRLKILSACQAMGYRLQPEISNAMRYIRSPEPSPFRGTIGLISWYRADEIISNVKGTYGEIVRGLREEALRIGYGVELFEIEAGRTSSQSLTRKLLDCGVRGVIIGPQRAPVGHLDLGWEHFTTVAIGYSLREPVHHRINSDLVGGISMVCDQLHALGYQRIALAIPFKYDQRVDFLFTSGYLGWQSRMQTVSGPLLIHLNEGEPSHFSQWMHRTRPDALITYHLPQEYLDDAQVRIPEEVGMVHLDLESTQHELSGLYQNQALMGPVAVQRIVGQLASADMGVPKNPTITLVKGRWVAGRSTRPVLKSC